MAHKELSENDKYRNYIYENYMCNQPMRDGLEIRLSFEELNEREKKTESEVANGKLKD